MAFERDDEWTHHMQARFMTKYYDYISNGRYAFINGKLSFCAKILQKELAIDSIYQNPQGDVVCAEEKIERWPGYPRTNFALETDSCTVPGHEKQGWMHYAKADILLYGFSLENEEGIDLYKLNFQPLKHWFWHVYQRYDTYTMPTLNRTRIRKVPIAHVLKVSGVFPSRYIITYDGIEEIPLYENREGLQQRREKLEREAIYASVDIIGNMRQAQYDEDPWLEGEDA